MNGLTGADIARQILDRNGLTGRPGRDVAWRAPLRPLRPAQEARCTSRSPSTTGRSIASTAIAAHEVGHAIQHEKAYAPFRLRSALWPAVAFASNAWIFLLMIGVFAQLSGSSRSRSSSSPSSSSSSSSPCPSSSTRRAGRWASSNDLGLVTAGESQGARKVLTAAAMTYVAAALAALSQLAYYALVFLGNRN